MKGVRTPHPGRKHKRETVIHGINISPGIFHPKWTSYDVLVFCKNLRFSFDLSIFFRFLIFLTFSTVINFKHCITFAKFTRTPKLFVMTSFYKVQKE